MSPNLCMNQDASCSGLDPCGLCASEIVTKVLVPALHRAQVTRDQAQAFLLGFTEGHRGLRAERLAMLEAIAPTISEAPPPVTQEHEELYESLSVDEEPPSPQSAPPKRAPKKTLQKKSKARVSPKRATMNGPVTNSNKKEEIT